MNPITISALNTHILSLFERDDLLRDVWVLGEVSNWKRAASGHIYFSLKDSGASISAVMWRNAANSLRWLPQEGDQVMAHGYVGMYAERGTFQLYVNDLRPAGKGQLFAAFEALKAKLATEGLFDVDRKREIPQITTRIGVITSGNAAAFRDILRVVAQRWPMLDVILFPTLVQGAEAPAQIVKALAAANRFHADSQPLDLLILARGGGSIEDLWSFNDERVARAVAQSDLPVITGVGHETDFTIVDFVADLRAPTPSAAAAAATRNQADARMQLQSARSELDHRARVLVAGERMHLEQRLLRLGRLHPQRQLDLRRQRLDDRMRRLHFVVRRALDRRADRVSAADLRLQGLNPVRVLERGYSIVQRMVDGVVVTDPAMVQDGASLRVRAAGGEYVVTPIGDAGTQLPLI